MSSVPTTVVEEVIAGPADHSTGVLRIAPTRGWVSLELGQLWAYRELVYFLVWRDVKVRYKQTMLGVIWALLQPLVTMVIFSVIFGRLARLPSDGVPYPVFTLSGLLAWQLFANAVTSASASLVGNSSLVTKVYFPRLVIPLAAVGSAFVDFLIACTLLFALMLWYGIAPGSAVVALPLFVLLAVTAAFGVGLWASALNVQYRDVQYVVPFALQIWFFISPVAYSARLVPAGMWRAVYALNPIVGILDGFRWTLLGGPAPGWALAGSIATAIVVLVGGLYYFRWMEDRFVDVI